MDLSVDGMLGGPINALQRHFLALSGQRIGEERQELGPAATGADAEIAEVLEWQTATLAGAMPCSRRLMARHG